MPTDTAEEQWEYHEIVEPPVPEDEGEPLPVVSKTKPKPAPAKRYVRSRSLARVEKPSCG